MKKILLYILFSFLGMYLLLFAFLHTDYAKTHAIQYIESYTDHQIEIGSISLLPPFTVTATNVKVHEIADVNTISFKISPVDLFYGDVTLKYLNIDDIIIKKFPNQSKGSGSVPCKINIESLNVQNLRVPFEELKNPICIEGNIFFDPEIEYLNGVVRFSSDGKTFQTTLSLLKDIGHFRLSLPTSDTLEGKFAFMKGGSINFSDLKGKAGPILWEGSFDVDDQWKILQSNIAIHSLELSNFTPVQGKFEGSVQVSGNILNPVLHANFFSDRIQNGADVFEKIAISVSTQSKMGLDFVKDGHPYHFTGNMTWDSPLSPKFVTTLDISEILQVFGADTSNISGQLGFDIDFSNGKPFGDFLVKNFAYESYDLGCSFKGVECKVFVDGQKLTLNQIKGSDRNGGHFSGNGEMKLNFDENFPFEVRLKLENSEIFNLDNFKATATGDVKFKGDLQGASIEGNIAANSIRFRLPEHSQVSRNNLDITYINQSEDEPLPTQFKKSDLAWPLKFNISIKADQEVSVVGTGLVSSWKGKAVVTGTPDHVLVNGVMHLKDGSYLFRGKKFDIKSGTVELKGDLEKDTTLYVVGEMEIDKITAEVIVKGSAQNPAISFRSTPSMSQREILSWILFNKGLSDISQFQGTQLNTSITDLIKAADTGPDLLTRLQNSLGLDRLEFSGKDDGMNLQVGKYIAKGTFLTLSRNSCASTMSEVHVVGIETFLRKNIKFQAEVDDGGNGQANIIWKKDY